MGAWGYKPLENDTASDLFDEFKETKDTSILESALDKVNDLEEGAYLEAPEAEEALATIYILLYEEIKINKEDLEKLLKKSGLAIAKIIENSELKELWEETDDYGDWLKSLAELLEEIALRLK